MMTRTTIRLSDDLMRRAKRKAAAEGRTLTALIEDALRMFVTGKPKTLKRRHVVLPVSSATGGPRPGFERMSFSEIQELDDLEYVERMKHFR
jgi:hypothetical protein